MADESLPSKEKEKELLENNAENNYDDIDAEDKKAIEREKRVRDKSKEKVKKKKTEKNAVILALVTAGVLILAILGISMSVFTKTVPDLSNMTLDEAVKAAQKSGYKISEEVEYSFSDDVAENTVISQMPKAGEKAPKHEDIKLVISLGATGGSIEVPNLVNSKVDDAIAKIDNLSLVYNIIYDADSDVEIGTVIRQTPLSGTHVNAGDVVTIHISSGASLTAEETEEVKVPALQMQLLNDAKSAITSSGLGIGSISYVESNAVAEGKIIKQKPDAGTNVKRGTLVSLVVSKGSLNAPAESEKPEETEKPNSEKPNDNKPSGSVKRYSVRIPDSAEEMVHIKIVANGNVMHDSTHSKSEGVVVQEITGSGSVRVQTYIDGVLSNDETLQF